MNGQNSSGRRGRRYVGVSETGRDAAPEDAARYLATLLPELRDIADRTGLHFTAKILKLAQKDVEEHLVSRDPCDRS
jgi:hypothetical protein